MTSNPVAAVWVPARPPGRRRANRPRPSQTPLRRLGGVSQRTTFAKQNPDEQTTETRHFCLEGDWWNDLNRSSTVKPVLKLLCHAEEAVTFVHRDAGTLEELHPYLGKWSQRGRKTIRSSIWRFMVTLKFSWLETVGDAPGRYEEIGEAVIASRLLAATRYRRLALVSTNTSRGHSGRRLLTSQVSGCRGNARP